MSLFRDVVFLSKTLARAYLQVGLEYVRIDLNTKGERHRPIEDRITRLADEHEHPGAMEDPKTGLVLGYRSAHPFSRVKLTDRASVQELLRTLLDPLEPFFSPGKARVRCPGATAVRFDQAAVDVEGICRPMWGLAGLLAGGGDYHGTEWWVQGLKTGTDPESPEYWGYPRDNDQRMVEMCPLGKSFVA